ncbi:hypothetical protein WN55_10108 [Dufourea novaeangliae]|uniref:Uncharacterized protein n=1 Tax=Dufourea novaeangliae TaxID=178035 RepID=A0A154P2N2_DUFNO|nr:hypothetical protein WN55_10108 [Dufourea novaeangliae]
MSNEIILKTLTAGSNIPFVDEDGVPPAVDHHRARSSVTRRELTKETVVPSVSSRYGQGFTTFRSMAQTKISQEVEHREGTVSMLQRGAMFNQKDSVQLRYTKQSAALKRNRCETLEAGPQENPLQRYENAVLKYQKPKARPKRQASRDRRQPQQQQNHGYSSSDESVVRNKSKSISSIDTQSVNNILDEYEDLDYRRSSDLSDVGSISVSNFEAVMIDQQKKQQQDRSRVLGTRMQTKCSPIREKAQQPVLKINQQTQVRQRSRERQKETVVKHVPPSPTEDNSLSCVSSVALTIDASRNKVPEVLLRKGEVQKRVDEWLSQAQSQNFPASREKLLTRSNSSAEQKTQRRYRQDSRSRSIDEGRDKLNGTSSSYDDLSRADKKTDRKVDKVNVGVNTSRGTYKEYLALKNRSKQQDYGFSASNNMVGRTRDISPSTGSRIPQRGPLSSSFRSRRLESSNEEGKADGIAETGGQHYQAEKNCRGRSTTESRLANSAKTRNESDHGRISGLSGVATAVTGSPTTPTTTNSSSSSSVIPCRRPSFKRSQNHDQSASSGGSATRPLVKEETGQRARGGAGGGCGGSNSSGSKGPSNLGDQGEPISPNKDGESRRPTLTSDSPRAGDKATDAACKSMEASRSGDRPTRDNASITVGESVESRYAGRQDKRENRMDRPRQESVYGAVGARVRTLQGQQQQEPRVTKPRSLQGWSNLPAEARKPPVLPRRDPIACSQDIKNERPGGSPMGSPQSTFKPNNSVYAALQQLNEQNSAKSRASTVNDSSSRSSHYSSPNHVEKIYERSLQPQVIHADDLESLLRPSLQVSAYGEPGNERSDLRSPSKETTIEEDDQKSEASLCRYPEIGLSQCLKIQQQALPNGRLRLSPEKRKDSNTGTVSVRRDQSNEPSARTFVTFHSPSDSPRCVKPSQQSRTAGTGSLGGNEQDEKRDVPEQQPVMILEEFEIPYDSENPHDRSQSCHTRENSNLSSATIPLDELESEREMAKFKVEELSARLTAVPDQTLEAGYQDQGTLLLGKTDKTIEKDRTNSREIDDRVVNEVLVKNLQFKQDLPAKDHAEQHVTGNTLKIIEHVGHQKPPIGFHNVLCDNYENLQNGRFKENKVYVTKEEMERQRLMDMLRKGDYESVKAVSDNRRTFSMLFLSRATTLTKRFTASSRSTTSELIVVHTSRSSKL